jgi:hypothetical protein
MMAEHTCEICGTEKDLVESYVCPNIVQDLVAQIGDMLDELEKAWGSGTS